MLVYLNGEGDLGIYGDIRPYIYKMVYIIKVCKSGLYQVKSEDGYIFSVPKYNLGLPKYYI